MCGYRTQSNVWNTVFTVYLTVLRWLLHGEQMIVQHGKDPAVAIKTALLHQWMQVKQPLSKDRKILFT